MLDFNSFRNAATDIWRDDDIARHRDNVSFPIPPGARLVLFPGDLYATAEQSPEKAVPAFMTVVDGVTFRRVSRTQIARVLYALAYVHPNGLKEVVNEAAGRASCKGAFSHVAEAFGTHDVDQDLLCLTIRVNRVHWRPWDISERRTALCQWIIAELGAWAKTPKTERV